MQVKSFVKIAFSLVLTFMIMFVAIPFGTASADTIDSVQSNAFKSQFNTEKTEMLAHLSNKEEQTAIVDETFKDDYKNTGCLALAEGQDATAIELEENEMQCRWTSQCTRCNGGSDCTHVKIGPRCEPCN